MPKVHILDVMPRIPEKLHKLYTLAFNLRWAWDHQTIELFRRLDPDLLEELSNNPVALLGRIDQERYWALEEDDAFMNHLERCVLGLEVYLRERKWFQKAYPGKENLKIAYFSAEFGLHECMPVYSGGLGVLAGDHLKSNSDLGIPIIGVGLLYQRGYFQQYLNPDGWQQERYKVIDFANTPITTVKDESGEPVMVKVEMPGREVYIQCWQVDVGRVPLFLLDTNLEKNSSEDRNITDELYGGDQEKRIKQEIILGIGGYRMLKTLNLSPEVIHMNEGHSAFAALERMRILREECGLAFEEAREAAVAGNVFTTHTPVPAGNDVFPPELMKRYFTDYLAKLGLTLPEFMKMGENVTGDGREGFCMTVLAIKLSAKTNGVSVLHREISSQMWRNLWPGMHLNEIPIIPITNGVHPATWISPEMQNLLTRYLGPQWQEKPHDTEVWQRIDRISDEELWRTQERGRERLVAFVRRRLRMQLTDRGASESEIRVAEDVLNPECLTIGFARRFATYKRAVLLLKDPDHLKRIILDHDRPVQFIFAGKAHPQDEPGKEFIRRIIHFIREEDIRRRVVFLENYDIGVARQMVRGVDVWLNTPRRPLEACGTSGMKAAFNGALNLSTLDGWWDEGFRPNLGWAIGKGEEYEDNALQDEIESHALYDLLEQEIIPIFYRIGASGIPRDWVRYIKESMKALCPEFSTNRMTFEYNDKFYLLAAEAFADLAADNFSRAKELAGWKKKLAAGWSKVKILDVTAEGEEGLQVNDYYKVSVKAQLGTLNPEDVSIELYYGRVDENREIVAGEARPLDFVSAEEGGKALFSGMIPLKHSGQYGFSARVVPNHRKLSSRIEPGYIVWE